MNPANDNDELVEANAQAAKAIIESPVEPLTAELEPNPPITAVMPELIHGMGRVITIQCQEDA